MKEIFFITGNSNKFNEIQAVIPVLKQLKIDLPEIQSMNPKVIIEAKLQSAFDHHQGPFIVEDTSLSIKGLNGLPGTFIKWFLESIGPEGIYSMAENSGDIRATARTMIGFAKDLNNIRYFEGLIEGKIVKPDGEKAFGWDYIFVPEGEEQTFAAMGRQAKNSISMRRKAAEKLKEVL